VVGQRIQADEADCLLSAGSNDVDVEWEHGTSQACQPVPERHTCNIDGSGDFHARLILLPDWDIPNVKMVAGEATDRKDTGTAP